MFWYYVEDAVGWPVLLEWMNHLQDDYRGGAFTGDMILEDFRAFTGVDLYNVQVNMYQGTVSNVVDGWLRTKNDYPVGLR
jgi:hypothetical protein